MSCDNTFSQGAVLDQAKIIDSAATNLHVTNLGLSGTVTADQAAQLSLVALLETRIRQLIRELLADGATLDNIRDIAAGAFSNCQELPLVPGVKLATCQDLQDALAASCCGSGGGGGGGGLEVSGDLVTNLTYTAGTRLLRLSVSYPDGSAANRNFDVTLPEALGGGDTIKAFSYDQATRRLRITSEYPDATPDKNWDVTLPAPTPTSDGECCVDTDKAAMAWAWDQGLPTEVFTYNEGPATALVGVNTSAVWLKYVDPDTSAEYAFLAVPLA